MKVCIAEKPSVAREIAEVLGARTKKNGYLEGNGYQVTWTFGHLCTLKEPHEYFPEWKRWALGSLPMIPPRFGIKLIENKGIKEQFEIIESLVGRAEMVINCGDAGQEGELIQRWVLQKAGCRCPVYRLWISSLTEDAIREGFKQLKNQTDYTKLYEAGLSRAMGDWLLGMNATRLYTLKYGQNKQVLSIGRVQTPTLALIVNRQQEIENFKPEQYWELKTVYRDTTFSAVKGRFTSKEEGEAFLAIVSQNDFTITDINTKKGKEAPPRLFDLTALQVECNKKFAFSAEDTLKYIQSLYEKKVTTYPRVDTTFLSDDIYPKIPATLKGMASYAALTAPLLQGKLPKSKKVFDNSKVTDHHAIIPTGVQPRNLTEHERKVYDLVARRFIAAFYPDCLISTTTVLGKVEKVAFKVTGKQILSPGWRVVFEKETKESDNENDPQQAEVEGVLPDFVKGESGPHKPTLGEKWTQPPKPYTEATLLRTMETAGKLVDNDELRDALKENGIGRPSTRAAIIETLFKRNYIRKERKNLFATATGVELIGTIREELLKSAELTGIWEKKLRQIERGAYEARTFLDELKQMLAGIVQNVKQESGRTITIETVPAAGTKPQGKENTGQTTATGKEKKARKPTATRKPKTGDTGAIHPPVSASHPAGDTDSPGKTPESKRRENEPSSSTVSTASTGTTDLFASGPNPTAGTDDSSRRQPESTDDSAQAAPEPGKPVKIPEETAGFTPPVPVKESSVLPSATGSAPDAPGEKLLCPLCKKGVILRGRTAYGCSGYKNGCNFRIDFATYGNRLSEAELTEIIRNIAGRETE